MIDIFLERYLEKAKDNGIDPSFRHDLAVHGQHPEAIVICCSDSRVSPEIIFNASLGEFFVIRTAGNTLGENEFRSIEYAYHHLHVKNCIVLAHTNCGAICCALEDESDENELLCHIHRHIKNEKNPCKASIINALEVQKEIQQRLCADDMRVYALLYDIDTGHIDELHYTEE